MKVLIMRHTKALHKDEANVLYDAERPLSEAGREDAKKLSDYLLSQGIKIGEILCSPFFRCHQTANIMASALTENIQPKALSILAPGSGVEDLMRAVINHAKGCKDWVLCVLHQPDVSHILGSLICTDSSFTIPVRNGDLYALNISNKHGLRNASLIFSYSIKNASHMLKEANE